MCVRRRRQTVEIGNSIVSLDLTAGMATRQKSISGAFLVLLALVLACGKPIVASAQAADNARPRISAIRVGLGGCYKVGHWTPICVDASGLTSGEDARIEVTVIDSDGVDTTSAATIQATEGADKNGTATIYTKVGRVGAPIRIALFDGDTSIAQAILRPTASRTLQHPYCSCRQRLS